MLLKLCVFSGLFAIFTTVAEARVVKVRIERREIVLNGKVFGSAGPYDRGWGRVEFALDMALAVSSNIVDPKLANG